MEYRIIFYGQLKEFFGSDDLKISSVKKPYLVQDLKCDLEKINQNLVDFPYNVAVNNKLCSNEIEIEHNEIHVMPPFAGG